MLIPEGTGLRIVGDVHGDARAFVIAAQTDRFIVQLGDLVDDGPDTPGALQVMFRLLDEKRGMFVLGNHDFKLARALRGDRVHGGATMQTLEMLPESMRTRCLAEIAAAPAWAGGRGRFFVHGAFHPGMLAAAPPCMPVNARPDPLLARALYGQTTGRVTGAGRPERLLRWVDDIPAGMVVYCGHDQRSQDGRPYTRPGRAGGVAVFMDTGAGKGGHLSWVDIDPL